MKIVITGAGVVSAIGLDKASTVASLQAQKSGIGPLKHLQTVHSDLPCGEVDLSDDEMKARLGIDAAKVLPRTSLLGIIAAKEALEQAGIDAGKRPMATAGSGCADAAGPCGTVPDKSYVLVNGTTVGGMDITERTYPKVDVSLHDCGGCTDLIADYFGIFGQKTTISTACSSAVNAIIFGSELIKAGRADVVLAGGSESLSKYHLNGFNTLMILDSARCRPFDSTRAGLNLGEGAGFVVLESEEHAKARGAEILAEVSGYANACDAFHQTATSPEGTGAGLAMSQAIGMAGLKPADIDYVNAHGTGTPNNDATESAALRRIFGDALPPVSSTKSYTGHTTSASGGIETVICLEALKGQFLPTNLGWENPDPDCISPYVGTGAKSACPDTHAATDTAAYSAPSPAAHAATDPDAHAATDPAAYCAPSPDTHAATDPAAHSAPSPAASHLPSLRHILCNSFGFGGNDSALVLSLPNDNSTMPPFCGEEDGSSVESERGLISEEGPCPSEFAWNSVESNIGGQGKWCKMTPRPNDNEPRPEVKVLVRAARYIEGADFEWKHLLNPMKARRMGTLMRRTLVCSLEALQQASATGDASVSAATSDASVPAATGDASVPAATGDASVPAATGSASVSAATGGASVAAAAHQAANAQPGAIVPDAVITATGLGCMENSEKFLAAMLDSGETMMSPTDFMQSTHNTPGSLISIHLGDHGYNSTYSQGECSLASALMDAFLQLKSGRIRTALVGAHDEITPATADYPVPDGSLALVLEAVPASTQTPAAEPFLKTDENRNHPAEIAEPFLKTVENRNHPAEIAEPFLKTAENRNGALEHPAAEVEIADIEAIAPLGARYLYNAITGLEKAPGETEQKCGPVVLKTR